jgi:hypothetical protein
MRRFIERRTQRLASQGMLRGGPAAVLELRKHERVGFGEKGCSACSDETLREP